MKIGYTRAMLTAALNGQLDDVKYVKHDIFNLEMPTTCPGDQDSVLDPRSTWPDKAAYDAQARKLAAMFIENFKTFEKDVDPGVKAAGPRA
jgi:phosphoenolpyruvate carboxykinase (ATP)